MPSIHNRASRKHKKLIGRRSKVRIQRNVDLLMYLNYLRFVNALVVKANELCDKDSSSEILPKHLEEAKREVMKRFRG
ncbi:DEKNAAC101618 [Brettanomyces naardenensis]|uniref:DEKNAAC101618 n=1 Tax=Brettanomyces naardenensis TaxID=13370 RepID=A0A448YIJ8_BRENA|nr:DEKNAAC101618 [Brettanomyces naardenensis]